MSDKQEGYSQPATKNTGQHGATTVLHPVLHNTLYEGVKDGIGLYRLRVVEVVVINRFSVDVEFLYRV